MKILVSGCSFSRGPISWPNHIVEWSGSDLVNLAQAGAGNTYISRSIMAELQERDYDLVLVMWSGLERIDLQVEAIDMFDQTIYTSKYQSSQNDWPTKIISPINDQDYVEKNWVFGVGHINKDPFLCSTKLFEKQYYYQDYENHAKRSFYDMLSLQSYLEGKSIAYAFSFYKNYGVEWLPYKKQLNQKYVYDESNPFSFATDMNDFEDDGLHPGANAQKAWATLFFNWLTTNISSFKNNNTAENVWYRAETK